MLIRKSLTKTFVLTIAIGALVSGTSSAEQGSVAKYSYLQCDFDKASMVVGFTENPTHVVDVVYPLVPLQKYNISDYEISFESDNQFYSYDLYRKWKAEATIREASLMTLRINRLTGGAKVAFFPEYGPADEAACRAKQNGTEAPWCKYAPVTDTKDGLCRPVAKRF